MKNSKFALCLSSTVVATALASLALPAEAQIYIRRPEIVIGAPAVIIAPPAVYVAPQPVYVAPQPVYDAPQPVYDDQAVVEEYVPAPTDTFIIGAAPEDIIFIGGDTFIWSVDPYGHRVRHFYGHGDRRDDIGRRGEHLRQVRERNGGRLPPHGETRAQAVAHAQQHAATGGGHQGGAPGAGGYPGGAPGAGGQAGGGHAAGGTPAGGAPAGGGHPGGAPAGGAPAVGGHPGGAPAGGGHPAVAAHAAPAKSANEKK